MNEPVLLLERRLAETPLDPAAVETWHLRRVESLLKGGIEHDAVGGRTGAGALYRAALLHAPDLAGGLDRALPELIERSPREALEAVRMRLLTLETEAHAQRRKPGGWWCPTCWSSRCSAPLWRVESPWWQGTRCRRFWLAAPWLVRSAT